MKVFLVVVVFFFMRLQVVAQEKCVIVQACGNFSYNYRTIKEDQIKDENYIYKLVHKKAEPYEGLDIFLENLKSELSLKIKRPVTLNTISVKIRFVVEKDGTLTNMNVLADQMNIANDVFKLIQAKSKWKPAQFDNKNVRMYFTLPIKIALD